MATEFTLYYDGRCPLCTREVRLLRRADRTGRLGLVDIHGLSDAELPAGFGRGRLLALLHGRAADGAWLVGPPAMRAAYLAAGRGWMMAWTGWPGIAWCLERVLYPFFARHRLRIGRWFGAPVVCDDACRLPGR